MELIDKAEVLATINRLEAHLWDTDWGKSEECAKVVGLARIWLTDLEPVLPRRITGTVEEVTEQLEALPKGAVVHNGLNAFQKRFLGWTGPGVAEYATSRQLASFYGIAFTVIYLPEVRE